MSPSADGRITEVGKVSAKGKEEIDAKGKLVTPGFVDVHTHYDGQVTWSQDITPSSQNGVTTVVMGNCGVGFAPCRPDDHDRLIQLMEGVEDIPEPVLTAGIPWDWESFPDYLDWLSKRQLRHRHRRATAARGAARLCDGRARRATAIPRRRGQHGDGGARRRRGARRRARLLHLAHAQPPHLDRRLHADAEGRRGRADRDRGRACTAKAAACCSSCSISRTHRRRPADDAAGGGEHQVARSRSRSRRTTRRRSAGARRSTAIDAAAARRPVDHGADRARVRSGCCSGCELSRNPFQTHPSYKAIAQLPLAERLARLRQPEVRAAILSETRDRAPTIRCSSGRTTTRCICSAIRRTTSSRRRMRSAPQARREGSAPEELAYDAMLTDDGRGMLYVPFLNYADGNLDATREMLRDPHSVPGLSDGGAHCGIICDAQLPDLSADALDARPHPRRKAVDPVRGGGCSRARPRSRSASTTAA